MKLDIEKFSICLSFLNKIFKSPTEMLSWLMCPNPDLYYCSPLDFIVENAPNSEEMKQKMDGCSFS